MSWLQITVAHTPMSDHSDLVQGTIQNISDLPFLGHWCPFWSMQIILLISSCMIHNYPRHTHHLTLRTVSTFAAGRTGTLSAFSCFTLPFIISSLVLLPVPTLKANISPMAMAMAFHHWYLSHSFPECLSLSAKPWNATTMHFPTTTTT